VKKFTIFLALFFSVFIFGSPAWAIPSLGVATNTYNNQDATGQEYVDVFASNDVSLYPEQGFVWDGSESLTIWVGQDNGIPGLLEQWEQVEVFLVTNSAAGDDFKFNDTDDFSPWIPGYQIDGYHRTGTGADTYYFVSLGNPFNNSDWSDLVDPAFPGQWYVTSGDLYAPGFLGGQTDWLFAVADFDGSGGIGPDISGGEFSPKTTSAFGDLTPVPEPTTMLLFSSGLIGLAGFRRKFKKS
jgi:hypothetical protein